MAQASKSDAYDRGKIESYWRARWEEDRFWEMDVERVDPEEKYYNLAEFPYPSAEGLHVGHVYAYCGADTFSHYQRMRGKKIFQPIGFDSFGINAENYALRVGVNPRTLIAQTIRRYREQLKLIGAVWNWDHEIITSDPKYYRWTQWIFLQLYRAGLAVRKEAPVVWCPSCLTVLANEQLEGDQCERCGTQVTHKLMKQWFLRITAYADALYDGLDHLDWPELSKSLQREWIGRSQGCEIDFTVKGRDIRLAVFTTRPDTLFGVTYLALALDHPLLGELVRGSGREDEVHAFIRRERPPLSEPALSPGGVSDGTTCERGVFTGAMAINPANGREVPVYVADYVVSDYGTSAIMGVPAHDKRDYEFAKAMGLPMIQVIDSREAAGAELWTGDGVLLNSDRFSGQTTDEARASICAWLEQRGHGRPAMQYRLHDWLISRQRYWGPPIPIIYCQRCGIVPVPEEQLPVLLPDVEDFRPTGTAVSPLAAVASFVNVTCPQCGATAQRETDVSDTFFDSCWYFLRYPSSERDEEPWDPDLTARLLPVDVYFGGKEHIMRHHLYARFVTMALHDLGYLPFAEPFPRLLLHGMMLKDGAKMSKSRGNVVNPDDYIAQHGSDNLRMYMLFCGSWKDGGDFSDAGLIGIERFTFRLWSLIIEEHQPGRGGVDLRVLDRSIKKVQDNIEDVKFNIAIAGLMELFHWISSEKSNMSSREWQQASRTMILLLAPFAPHLAEELWSRVGGHYSVHTQAWPRYREKAIRADTIQLAVQVNGKLRDVRGAPAGLSQKEAEEIALSSERVRQHLNGRSPRKVIFVPNRLINIVV